MDCDLLISNVNLATMAAGGQPYGAIVDGALAVRDGLIAWLGPRSALPTALRTAQPMDGGGGWLTPGLIDCHTHLVHAGNRAGEFEQRLRGASYADIARAGGGIMATVRATRAASLDALIAASLPRARALAAEGVTTVEIKSGYGLELATEARMLRAARALGDRLPLDVRTSFLGAHALPPAFADDRDGYLRLLCETMLPALAGEGLVDAVDGFCETIGFTPVEISRLFTAARALGLPVKLHAEQLSDQGGAALAATFAALSADHLEYASAASIAAMAAAGTVAVLLPGAYYMLRETTPPPVALLRAHGVPMALATDCNPGTAPVTSLLLMLNMGCVLFGLTPEEALAGITREAARALGLTDRGRLAAGLRADLVLWDIAQPAELAYALGANPRRASWHAGLPVVLQAGSA